MKRKNNNQSGYSPSMPSTQKWQSIQQSDSQEQTYQTALSKIAPEYSNSSSSVSYLTAIEWQLLDTWNTTEKDFPEDKCIHGIFEERVDRILDSVAINFGDEQLTYRVLNERANQLAHYLQHIGIGPEVLVGICIERSVDLIVGLLGILKAGGAYVPLDPTYPRDRIAFILHETHLPLVLTQDHLYQILPVLGQRTFCLDRDWETIETYARTNPISGAQCHNLAYVIYTSGSTGKPKGVSIEHIGVNRLLVNAGAIQVEASDRVAQSSNISFDISTFEIWGALLNGAQLIGITNGAVLAPQCFAEEFLVRGISVSFLATAVFQHIVREVPWAFRAMRSLLVGGEKIDVRLVNKVLLQGPPEQLLNVYGPTECTVLASTYGIEQRRLDENISLPIGRPLPNIELYVLDERWQPVPPGTPGELYIGGKGLGRNYLNRPELTAERFIPDPFRGKRGARLYKTGDMAKYLSDGNIEFLGRVDHQVKIRGFRLELGEIESVLLRYPFVSEAVVAIHEDIDSNKSLVAYVVPSFKDEEEKYQDKYFQNGKIGGLVGEKMQERLHASAYGSNSSLAKFICNPGFQLREYLQKQLPEYMIPSTFVLLESLPLTPNGKLDRRALPVPDQSSLPVERYIAPRTALEEQLATIWSEILGVKQVGIYDNFFALGGHSLLMGRVIAQIRFLLRVELPLRALFEAPTIALLAPRLESMLTSKSTSSSLPLVPLLQSKRTRGVPLALAQQRLWFLTQLEPENPFYNSFAAWRLYGSLRIDLLERSIQMIIQRHEALRTIFSVIAGQPVQIVKADMQLPFKVVGLYDISPSDQEQLVTQLVHEEIRKPFDLSDGPLLRICLLRLKKEEHVLVLTVHHIIWDGWSVGVFMRELTTLYNALLHGRSSSLATLPIQYVDYTIWQREWLQAGVLDQEIAYWKHQLAGASPLLTLPTDRPRPPVQTYRGAQIKLHLPDTLTRDLKQLSEQEDVTLFMILLSAFMILLHFYSGQDDIIVGTVVANRIHKEIEELIGFFVNSLVLRANLDGNPCFRDLLKQIREVTLEAYAHQNVPFEKLVEELRPERNLSYNPLFQVLFALDNAPKSNATLEDIVLNPIEIDSATSKFDLALLLFEEGERLTGAIEYNTDLFDLATIERMRDHLLTLLQGIVKGATLPLSQLPMLSDAEQRELLFTWNDTQQPYALDMGLHHLFEAQTQRTPDAVAIIHEDVQITFQELHCRTNQLARYLRSLGVGPEVCVGICVERSTDMIVGLIGILKAGGAYVPLDPDYPQERLRLIADDSQFSVLLTQQHLVRVLDRCDVRHICLNSEQSLIEKESREDLQVSAAAANLAYVIYTSGSSGKPKGVAIPHRSACAFLHWAKTIFLSQNDDMRMLASTSICFDLSVFEIFVPLCWGGTIILARNILDLPVIAAEKNVTLINTVPSAMAELLRRSGLPETIRLVNLAGELLSNNLAQQTYQQDSVQSLFNLYGPSECTIYSTFAEIPGRDHVQVTIGGPINNTQVYILDTYRRLVPVGVWGELYIGGDGVGRGYLGRPELTAERFIPNPFSMQPGARLYRTGDITRHLPDGRIEYLGRVDRQVKVRGFRIEPGEIEAELHQHAAVRACAVIVREDIVGDPRLVAYVVVTSENVQYAATIADLRRFLEERLPKYMIPSAFVLLESLPLTPNGKLNRNALPVPNQSNLTPETYIAPRTALEEQLTAIWSEILEVNQVGIHDNFFELGGHSLLVGRVSAQIRTHWQIELPIRTLFETPTVALLAERLATLLALQSSSSLPSLLPLPQALREQGIPLSFAQQRLWFLAQLEPENPFYNSFAAWRLQGSLQVEFLESSIHMIVQRHEVLRTVFGVVDGEPVQIIKAEMEIPFPLLDLQGLAHLEQEHLAARLMHEETRVPFDLMRGPVLRACLLRLSQEEHILVLTIHHIAWDGWSLDVFMHDLVGLYRALVQKTPSSLPNVTVQYADYAVWQRSWLQGERLAQGVRYWQRKLAGVPELLALPTDRPRPSIQTHRGSKSAIDISPTLTAALRSLGKQEGATLFMTLLAAFMTLLHFYTKQNDIVVGTDVANRTHKEIEGLIGFFVNSLVLRVDLQGNPHFRDLLQQVREVTLEAYAHQDVPFEKLVEVLQPERNLSYNPLYQAKLVLQSMPTSSVEFPGVKVSMQEINNNTARFDLLLNIIESEHCLMGYFEYNTDIFEAATISEMGNLFEILLQSITTAPDSKLSTVEEMLAKEQKQRYAVKSHELKRMSKQKLRSIKNKKHEIR